jgi:hypothetical protein
VRFLLRVYPRPWRERYGDELLAVLEAAPLTWRVRADVLAAGVKERLRGSGPPQLRVLRAWSLFVIGGAAFQKTSEHWHEVVPGDRAVPTVAFDTVQAAAVIGSAAVVAAIALALPAFLRDLRSGGWAALRRPLLAASAATVVAAVSLAAVAHGHSLPAALVFVASALVSLFAWTHAAVAAARRLPARRVDYVLALVVTATMVVMVVAAAAWFASVSAHAPSFVGGAQLAVVATFMLGGIAVAAAAVAARR